MLPDALARLQQQYDQLVEDVFNQSISQEDARQRLSQMVVIDGTGAHWSKDEEGNFTRADGPGQPAAPTDPSQFAADRLPPRPDATDVPPWADPHLMGGAPGGGPQGGDGQMPPGGAPWPGDGGGSPQHPQGGMGQPGGVMPAYQRPDIGRAKHLGDEPDDSLLSRARQALRRVRATVGRSGVLDKLPFDKRTGTVVLAGMVLLAVIFAYTRLATDPLEGGGVPVVPSDQQSEGLDDLPGNDDGTAAPTPPTATALPTQEDVNRVVSALTSADRAQTASVVVNPGSPTVVALQTAQMAGLERAQVALTVGAPAQLEDRVEARMALVDANTGQEYAQATVVWLNIEGTWKLSSWPSFTQLDG